MTLLSVEGIYIQNAEIILPHYSAFNYFYDGTQTKHLRLSIFLAETESEEIMHKDG
jgi:hypothetical protein